MRGHQWGSDHAGRDRVDADAGKDFVDRFGVIGTAEDCVARLGAVCAAGIDNVLIAALGSDPLDVIRRCGVDVLPAVK
ncbi:MAG: hypothetical protein ACPHDT_07020 [Acidimicrobiales bacterium]